MSRSKVMLVLRVSIGGILLCTSILKAAPAPRVEEFLLAGKLADAQKMLSDQLQANAGDEQSRFELGLVQFLRAVETLSQNLYRYGARSELGGGAMPFIQALNPNEKNPHPQKLTYESARAIVQQWLDDLGKAQATLAMV